MAEANSTAQLHRCTIAFRACMCCIWCCRRRRGLTRPLSHRTPRMVVIGGAELAKVRASSFQLNPFLVVHKKGCCTRSGWTLKQTISRRQISLAWCIKCPECCSMSGQTSFMPCKTCSQLRAAVHAHISGLSPAPRPAAYSTRPCSLPQRSLVAAASAQPRGSRSAG